MPFEKDPGNRESAQHCSYCYQNGELTYKGNDLKEFQRLAYDGMRRSGMNPILARLFTFTIRFAPRWKNQK